jgi:hypothetical protein
MLFSWLMNLLHSFPCSDLIRFNQFQNFISFIKTVLWVNFEREKCKMLTSIQRWKKCTLSSFYILFQLIQFYTILRDEIYKRLINIKITSLHFALFWSDPFQSISEFYFIHKNCVVGGLECLFYTIDVSGSMLSYWTVLMLEQNVDLWFWYWLISMFVSLATSVPS